MKAKEVGQYISDWLESYCGNAGSEGFVVGISGGVDSALTSTLCAKTGRKVIALTMPIRQSEHEYKRAKDHIADLTGRFTNVSELDIDLSESFSRLENDLPEAVVKNDLVMANSRARLRMLTLYAVAQANNCLVAGTGNKVEDFGVGFFTKYGDGGVDINPIADLTKSEVYKVADAAGVIESILNAKPTDGLWADGRCDEDQLGATYPELEWAMAYVGDESNLDNRQKTVLQIYRRLNRVNKHKMIPVPVCKIPEELKK